MEPDPVLKRKNYLLTSDIARTANVHPNTVRLYEQLGFLPPVERDPFNGYRRFTRVHLDQMLLARKVMRFNILNGSVRATAYDIIAQGAAGDLGGALELAYRRPFKSRLSSITAQGCVTDAHSLPGITEKKVVCAGVRPHTQTFFRDFLGTLRCNSSYMKSILFRRESCQTQFNIYNLWSD
jgi:hypothetical protein